MNATDVRLLMEITKRQAEEAFRRQMDESNRRIEMHMTAARVLVKEAAPEPFFEPRHACAGRSR
jgi:hypothetical protein